MSCFQCVVDDILVVVVVGGSVREVRVAVATILEKTLDSALFYQDKVSLTCKLDVF